MSESNPLAGLTKDEADQAIARFQAKADAADDHAKAAKAHLKAMKAARKGLEPPVPVDQQGQDRAEVNAQPAHVTAEGSDA